VLFNLGPFEVVVLIIVALIVFGPDKLPTLAKDAARMIRTLRELAEGARLQLRDELGPEFGDLDLRSLNPRTALQRAIFDVDDHQTQDDPASTDSAPITKPAAPITDPVNSPLSRNEAAPYDDDAT
jgi:sec-independent protein translocase protein TatB